MIARVKDSQTTHYDWDHNNRLKRIRPDGQDPRYLHYDASGIRDKRTLSGQKETFHTLSGVALADVRPTGPVAFVQGHQLLGLVKDGDLYHFIGDGLGTVRWVTDDAVNPVASFTCDPFGNPDPGGTSGNPDFLQHTYTGALGVRNDSAALGLYYAQQRYYDPHLGRWLTPDPIGFSGGLNLYAGMGNSPVNYVDPSGLDRIWGDVDVIPVSRGRIRLQVNYGFDSPDPSAIVIKARALVNATFRKKRSDCDVIEGPAQFPILPIRRGVTVINTEILLPRLKPETKDYTNLWIESNQWQGKNYCEMEVRLDLVAPEGYKDLPGREIFVQRNDIVKDAVGPTTYKYPPGRERRSTLLR